MASRNKDIDVEKQLGTFLRAHLGPKRRLLVAVSGGPDSMALLSACRLVAKTLRLKVFAAHYIHKPKSEEARFRARLVADYCKRSRIQLTVGKLTRGNMLKGSPEERMRQARYQFLERAAQEFSCAWILTGHHASDQAETVLMRVLTGTGPRGLIGIQERRGPYLRPLLCVSRSSLLLFCQARQIPFADDPANLDLSIPRNRLRHEILPLLRQTANPQVENALVRLGRWAAELDEVISDQVERCWREARRQNSAEIIVFPKGKIMLDIDAILPYYKMIRKYTLLKAINLVAGIEVALTATELDRAEALLHAKRSGTQLEIAQGIWLVKHGRTLIVAVTQHGFDRQRLPIGKNRSLRRLGIQVIWEPATKRPFESGAGWKADLEFSEGTDEVILRPAQEGDRFYPLGALGEKRLFRFLTDRRVSRFDKRHTWVLEGDGKILWVIGHRISEFARVGRADKGCWRLSLAPIATKR